ncbi:CinA family protein [Pontiella sp.]|uniref:CinA family protein n=1 Tax=Pontiella sp. TaxID=2837462 RepID=UPI00356AA47F
MNGTAKEIKALLLEAGKTVSVAESITAGRVQALLTSESGVSKVFKGGISAYQAPVKVELLGVDAALAERTDCVDEEIARQMATGALKLFRSDYAIATCGYAERPDGNPYAFFAIAQEPGTILHSERIELSGNRTDVQQEAAQRALKTFSNLLRIAAGP